MGEQKQGRAFSAPMRVSPELAKVVGEGPMPRTEVTKKVWEYIKSRGRQDPANKRTIIPDENLAAVFGSANPIDMFQMTKRVSAHLS